MIDSLYIYGTHRIYGSLYQIDTLGGIGSFNDADTIGRDDSLIAFVTI